MNAIRCTTRCSKSCYFQTASGWIEDTTIADALLRVPSHVQRHILCHSVRRSPPTAVHCRHVCEDRVRATQLHPLQPVEPACRAVPGTERRCQWWRCLGCHCRSPDRPPCIIHRKSTLDASQLPSQLQWPSSENTGNLTCLLH